jgi:hypothetical protein
METEFYVLLNNRAVESGYYPYYFELQKLPNYDTALQYYKENVTIFGEDTIVDLKPILITNNQNLYRQYRHILSENEFKLFCADSLLGYKCVEEYIGVEIFSHFTNIKNGEYNRAYQSISHEVWDEDKTGNSYEIESNNGWKTSN